MNDSKYVPRYHPSGRRSPALYNPARSSMPASMTPYGSMYSGDIHVIPTSRYDMRQAGDYRAASTVPTTTTTYTVRKDPVSRSSSVREAGTHTRRPSDSGGKRPIIVTTRQAKDSNGTTVSRTGSPAREPYRTSDEGQYYAQPASSIRSRSNHRHSYAGPSSFEPDDIHRLRERVGDDRLLSPRTETHKERGRPGYTKHPNHGSTTTIDIGDDSYEYTKPSDLARYDLDHDKQPRRSRRDSFDKYYRPSVTVSNDVNRPYETRPRAGPPPTTWGLDKVNRNLNPYERPQVHMPVPPAAPAPPAADVVGRRPAHHAEPATPTERRASSRTRPVSLYQELPSRQPQGDDYYRTRRDDVAQGELRDPERPRDHYHDDNVGQRGYGVRVDGMPPEDYGRSAPERRDREHDARKDRREPRRDRDDREYREPKRRSDEELGRPRESRKKDIDDRKVGRREESRRRDIDDRKISRRDDDERDRRAGKEGKDSGRPDEEREGKRMRDKVATGLSVAATALGLGAAFKDDKEDKEDKGSPRRPKIPEDERRSDPYEKDDRPTDRHRHRERDDERKLRPREDVLAAPKEPSDSGSDFEARSRNRRDTEGRPANADRPLLPRSARDESPPSDEATSKSRRRRHSSAFRPTDTQGLMELKAQLAAMDDKDKPTVKEKATVKEPPREPRNREEKPYVRQSPRPSPSPPLPEHPDVTSSDVTLINGGDESRGRELVPADKEEKQVRVVSPPRDKDSRPLKGILKQPSAKFPEEATHVREGVAPHKSDKTKKDVPTGARWTKISRKIVNAEALTLGKERFEVRDDFVIVLRVLSKEEIDQYALATAKLRENRRKEYEHEREKEKGDYPDRDRERDDDEERKRQRRPRRDDEDDRDEKDREYRPRRHRHEADDEEGARPRAIEYQRDGHSHHHRRDRDRDGGSE